MNLSVTVQLNAPPSTIWQHLTDPHQLSQSMPGLVTWQIIQPQRKFQLLLSRQLSKTNHIQIPVIIQWTHLNPPTEIQQTAVATLGKETINIQATVTLTPQPPQQTHLHLTAQIDTPNKFTDQLIRSTAPKLIDTFFKQFKQALPSV